MSKLSIFLCQLLIISCGILFTTVGWYLTFNWTDIFQRLRGEKMALSPTSPAYKEWKISPIPLHFDVYLFNWTNPDDFYVGSKVKPHFQELGPYRFLEKPDKVNITWFPHNSSVSYRNFATYHFDAEGSNGSLSDMVTSINSVIYEGAKQLSNNDFIVKQIVENYLSLNSLKLTTTKKAEEWLFKGYEDSILNFLGIAKHFIKGIDIPYDRVGYLYTRNDSSEYDGIMNIFTGAADVKKMGQIHTWNFKNHTTYPDQCGDVHGSMGQFFTPNLRPKDMVHIYLPNLCRAIPLEYQSTVDIHDVRTYKFAGGLRSVDNGTLYSSNKCFCNEGKCEPSGTINIGPCKYNSSVHMSYPHFYLADPIYLDAVNGLKPDPKKHEFFMALEPTSGIPLEVGGGFQANYLIEPLSFSQFENIPRTFIPLMWAEERVRVPYGLARSMALVPQIALTGQLLAGVLLAAGAILICWYPFRFIKRLRHDPKAKSKIIKNGPDLAEAARNSVCASVAHIKRPLQQISLLEYKQYTRSGTENHAAQMHNNHSVQPIEESRALLFNEKM